MPVVSIRHVTTYRYRRPVGFGEHRMMLRPLDSFDQRVIACDLTITPEAATRRQVHHVSGATVDVARFAGRSEVLSVECLSRVEHTPSLDFELETPWTPDASHGPYDAYETDGLALATTPQHPGAGEVSAWARRFLLRPGEVRASMVLAELTAAIRADFAYSLRLRGAPRTPQETLETRQGSCRDFAVLLMEAARSLGLASRFVTGYVYSTAPGARRAGGGHTHAWAQVYVPGCGWTDFDPTNGIIGNADLIRVAAVDQPRLAVPLYGTWDGEAADFMGMDVTVELETAPILQPLSQLRVAASN